MSEEEKYIVRRKSNYYFDEAKLSEINQKKKKKNHYERILYFWIERFVETFNYNVRNARGFTRVIASIRINWHAIKDGRVMFARLIYPEHRIAACIEEISPR